MKLQFSIMIDINQDARTGILTCFSLEQWVPIL